MIDPKVSLVEALHGAPLIVVERGRSKMVLTVEEALVLRERFEEALYQARFGRMDGRRRNAWALS